MSSESDKRIGPRIAVECQTTFTVLSDPPQKLDGRIENVSASGMRILLDRPLPLDAAIRIDLNDSLLLGEVCYCQPTGSGLFAIGIVLEHSLAHLAGLEGLMNRLFSLENRPRTRQPA